MIWVVDCSACVDLSSLLVQPPQLSKREIEDLLKKGAYGALMEGNDDDANRYCAVE